MPRKVPEWIGKTADSAVPERVQERLWTELAKECCMGCGVSLRDQAWDVDHICELKLWVSTASAPHGNRESNLQVLGVKCCHRPKTKAAMVEIHRTSRKVRHRAGIKTVRHPVPGSRNTRYKKKLDGTVLDRATGKVIGKRRA